VGRILALDLGRRRIGLALSDPLGLTAQGLETFERTSRREDLARLTRLVREREVERIVIGNPVELSGREGRQSQWAREFAERLADRTGVPVVLWDERLTSVEAERVLREAGGAGVTRGSVDRLAAMILLQSYLDSGAGSAEGAEGQSG